VRLFCVRSPPRPPTSARLPVSLHDALPISASPPRTCPISSSGTTAPVPTPARRAPGWGCPSPRPSSSSTGSALEDGLGDGQPQRSEEHTSELQSRFDLVCRLLLAKKTVECI